MVDYCDNPTYGSNCDTFYLSKSASVLSSIQGCIVGMSSILTLTVIYRSQIRLSSAYHRIMCSMSVMDLIASIAMALSTIPMPKDQIYPFEGAMIYGTTVTCEIQGFAYVVGFAGSSLYFCGLCCFYLCIINFRMSDKAIRTYLEPTIHLVSTGVPLACSVSCVIDRLANLFSFFFINRMFTHSVPDCCLTFFGIDIGIGINIGIGICRYFFTFLIYSTLLLTRPGVR